MTKFTITTDTKVKGKQRPIEDGEYTAVISKFTDPATSNAFFTFSLADGRVIRYFINSQQTLDIFTDNVNNQLDIEDELSWEEWLAEVIGSTVQLWLLTTQSEDGRQFQNPSLYKPRGFDASINGAL